MHSCIPGLYLKAHATGASLETSNHPESGKIAVLTTKKQACRRNETAGDFGQNERGIHLVVFVSLGV